jgi:ribosomal protein S18 acetylase RimI-like enzyme
MEALSIRPLATPAEAEACAAFMAASEPWVTLGREPETCLRLLQDPALERYVAYTEERLAGCLVLNLQGPFVGYVQVVCVAPDFRDLGLGSALVAFAETRIFRDHPNVFLCVSSFNQGARRLYERLGYTQVGELPDFIQAGHSEFLMRKTQGPRDTFRPKPAPAPGA